MAISKVRGKPMRDAIGAAREDHPFNRDKGGRAKDRPEPAQE
jgi:hypothetical protein